jgi:ankyrin repeat domain-containing protein 50
VNYLGQLGGGQLDELNKIQNELKELEQSEIVNAIVQTLGYVAAMSTSLENMRLSQQDDKVLEWLTLRPRYVDPSKTHGIARKKHDPATGNWFLRSKEFNKWLNTPNAALWLRGKPGAGKTILCSSVIEHVKMKCESDPSDQYAYFYFDFRERWTTFDMLRSVVAQLCAYKRRVPSELHQLYHRCRDGQQQPDQADLLEIICSKLVGEYMTYVILDALDECQSGAERDTLLETITKMTSRIHRHG